MTDRPFELIETPRLVLRRPTADDADTRAFLSFSDSLWERWPAGPDVILSRDDRRMLGSTGLIFETPSRATTGYVLAHDAWGRGFATEALGAMVDLARKTGVLRLYALCHHAHRASARVLEKTGLRPLLLENSRMRLYVPATSAYTSPSAHPPWGSVLQRR